MQGNFEIDDVSIRKANAGDVPVIYRFEQDKSECPRSENTLKRFIAVRRNCTILVAEFDEQVVGCVICELCLNKLKLLNVTAAEEFHGRGVRTRLIDELIATLRPDGPRVLMANVLKSNGAAVSFFPKLGFRNTGVLRDHFDSEKDAIRFEWELKGYREIAHSTALTDEKS